MIDIVKKVHVVRCCVVKDRISKVEIQNYRRKNGKRNFQRSLEFRLRRTELEFTKKNQMAERLNINRNAGINENPHLPPRVSMG